MRRVIGERYVPSDGVVRALKVGDPHRVGWWGRAINLDQTAQNSISISLSRQEQRSVSGG